jgi:phenylacetic acid degradation operon negative regulatory protein
VAPTAKSVILDLLSSLKGGALPVRALVAAGALFGIHENALRVALARLRATALVESDEPGWYRLGPGAQPIDRRTRSWRSVERTLRPWAGGWIAVLGATGGRRTAAQADARALAFLGFRDLAPGVALRPDNLAGGVAAARTELAGLGLSDGAEVCGLHDLAPATERRATGLWDGAALRLGYRRTIAALERSERRLATLPRGEAMAESFLLGGRAIRQIVLDPRLPEPLVPAAERRALIDATLRYDRAGRAFWASFLREMGVVPGTTPAHQRFAGDAAAQREAIHGGL